tara:strand:+ start:2744 stop:3712 length:969 start_codon:yes stop_codon:yes gene_type:complete
MGLKSRKKKIAFVGAGYMSNEHIKVFLHLKKRFLVTGIFNRTRSKANQLSKKYKIPYVANSIEDLYKKTSADVVLISVSETKVYEILSKAFQYPWKIMVEKPAGYNYKNANKIFSLAKNKKRLKDILVALNRRNYPTTLQVLENIKSIKSKRIINIHDQQNIFDPKIKKKPFLVRNNLMYCNSIHLIDYLNILCRGRIVKIKNILKSKKNKTGIILSYLKYSSGDIGIYKCVWNMPSPWSVSVTTNARSLELKPLEKLSVRSKFSKIKKIIKTINKEPKMLKPGLTNQAIELHKFLINKKNNLVSLKESLDTMRIIKKIYGI